MNGNLLLATLASAVVLSAAPTSAQAPTHPDAVASAARCVAVSDKRASRRLLDTLPGSDAERTAAGELADLYHACGNGELKGGFDARAALAAAVVEERLAAGTPDLSRVSAATPWYAASLQGRQPGSDYNAVELGIQEFGSCVVRAQPQASARLLGSARGSAAERAAIAEIKPALGACVVQGQELKLNAGNLRLMLAEPFYHAAVQ